jgi:nicotinamidase-related amidase
MKSKLLLLLFIVFSTVTFAQKLDSTALILIDIQNFYFPGGKVELTEPENAAEQAKQVLEYFRKNDGLVVHVRHNFQPGGEIHKLVEPIKDEKIITKDEVSCFLGTNLDDFLKTNNIKNVVLVGMQTHMCLEGGTRAAYDLGYTCTVIGDACATRDLPFGEETIVANEVHYSTLATLKSYAKVVELAEYINQ